ncbi:MAG: hypothetical protein PHQ41_04685 [Candidatus Cloacimonetes bacterium]|nr:hypothetical protein [Candidatus Cloacimonadota bacterium]
MKNMKILSKKGRFEETGNLFFKDGIATSSDIIKFVWRHAKGIKDAIAIVTEGTDWINAVNLDYDRINNPELLREFVTQSDIRAVWLADECSASRIVRRKGGVE